MATDVAAPMDTELPTPTDPISTALASLSAHQTLITNCSSLLQSIADHYSNLDAAIIHRAQKLSSAILTHAASTENSFSSLSARSASLPSVESSSTALISTTLTSALQHLQDPDLKLPDSLSDILSAYCLRMDSAGLWRFILSRRRDLAPLRKLVPAAVSSAIDPLMLVVDALDDFLDQLVDGGGDRYWVIGMLLRAVFVDAEGRKAPEVAGSVRERAGMVAEKMKGRMEGREVGGPEAHVFLQLVAAFGLSGRFEEEWVRKLVVEHASRKEIWKVVGGLGFGDKMADVIEELVKAGKLIEAVYFSHGSGLTERFPSVPLIKNYHQSSKKSASTILKNGNHSTAATEESSTLELNAIRSIIYCVEILKLEGEYPLENLRKRLNTLERAKNERKTASKFENKRGRASGGGSSRPSKAGRTSHTPYPSFRRNAAAAHQGPPARNYNYASQIPRIGMPYGGAASIRYDYAAPAQPAYPH